MLGYGAARERIAIAAGKLVKIPEALDFDRAAGLCVTYGTTLHALKDRAQSASRRDAGGARRLRRRGSRGGRTRQADGRARHRLRIVGRKTRVRHKARRRRRRSTTAKEDLKEALRRVTGGRGADVIYDPVGGAYAEPALRSIAWQGRFLVVGFAAGDIPKLPLNLVLLKGCDVRRRVLGLVDRARSAGHRANTEQLLAWCADGKLSSHIHAVYPLADGPAALKAIAARQVMGKVILRP